MRGNGKREKGKVLNFHKFLFYFFILFFYFIINGFSNFFYNFENYKIVFQKQSATHGTIQTFGL